MSVFMCDPDAGDTGAPPPTPKPRNRRLTDQQILRNRLERANWRTSPDREGYFYKGLLRIIVCDEGETLLTAFEEGDVPVVLNRIEWEISFGGETPWKVVMAAVNAAVERGG